MRTIILCGGSGTRLWPLSRKLMPKQFLKLFNNKSLFQLTIDRNKDISREIEIITNETQYFLALDQVEEIKIKAKFLLENIGKNTAPAITLAALNSDEEEILFITPSDHLISDLDKYKEAIELAKEGAKKGYIVTFGIVPIYPHTGYGYIESEKLKEKSGKILDVIKFHEKPNKDVAKEYVKKGNYFWNSGMFMFKAGVFLEEIKKYESEIYEEALRVYEKKKVDKDIIRFNTREFKNISVDYAVMERSKKIKVVKSEFKWNDVGSYDSLIEEIKSDEKIEVEANDNFVIKNNYTLKKEIALVGVENLIVVDTPDALLISKKGKSQKVKDVVNILKEKNKDLIEVHTKVYRPWGSYEVLVDEDKYKLKRIVVKPGKRLSLQKHFHRSEHWIVVSGTAKVIVGDREFLVRPNESTYIKMGEVHRLENPGKIPVVLIEAQVGEYTGEDDIIRIDDDFKRIKND